jgi:CheY-like chemotaxis protein
MPKSRVLIIDDDPMITQLLTEHLSNEGYDVAAVHTAEEGYTLATENSPDLIFLDVMLPDATGFQMLGRFRENPVTHAIPIIMMSGTARYSNQMEIGKNMGANAYVVKPFNVIEVGEKARELISLPKEETPQNGIFAETTPAPEPIERWTPLIEIQSPKLPDLSPQVEQDITTPRTTEPIVFMSDNADRIEESAEPPVAEPNVEEPAAAPAPSRAPRKFKNPVSPLAMTAGLFTAHLAITLLAGPPHLFSAFSYVAGGWALMIGLLVAVCVVLRIKIEAAEAVAFVRWAAVPIVVRALLSLMGYLPKMAMSPQSFWLRPLDLFEMVSVVIFGLCFQNLQGSNKKNSILAAVFVALAWSLTSRGFFIPR